MGWWKCGECGTSVYKAENEPTVWLIAMLSRKLKRLEVILAKNGTYKLF